MVLSLGFILAFIGAAVALLIGILIFSEVSDSIICPTPAGGGSGFESIGGFNNLGTLGDAGDAFYYDQAVSASFVTATGILGQAVIDNGTDDGNTDAQVEFGTDSSTWNFLHGGLVGSNVSSVNLWVNGDLVGAFHYPILGDINCESGLRGWCIEANSGPTRVRVVEDTNTIDNANRPSGEPADDSNWHMLTVVMDKGNTTGNWIKICTDSVCTNAGPVSGQFTGTVGDPPFNMTFGGGETSRGDHITFGVQNSVMVDEVAIWNGWELSQSEINQLWNSGNGLTASSIASGALRLYVSFDEGTEFNTSGGSGGSSGQGNAECEGAKDTAWTVIGILPVALFFALFAIFGALGRNN
jgi:hypothetical protein